MNRNRFLYGALLVGIIVAGLGTRRYGSFLPEVVATYGGDTLWALMVFVGLGLVARAWPTSWVAGVALAVSYGVEFSQLYHTPWLDELRRRTVGGLVLGRGFLWSDLACYTVGIGFGIVLELLWRLRILRLLRRITVTLANNLRKSS